MSGIVQLLHRLSFCLRFARQARLIHQIRRRRLSYCGFPKLETIVESVEGLKRRRVPGIFIEAGVALGGSAALIARLKPRNRPLYLYDVFDRIPPPSSSDGPEAHARFAVIAAGKSSGLGGDTYYGYQADLVSTVLRNLSELGVDPARDDLHLVRGLFEQTLHCDTPVAFAHIDCDWHEPVTTCIERISPWVAAGGEMIFDDYSSYSGCRTAVDEFLATSPSFRLVSARRSAVIRKLGV